MSNDNECWTVSIFSASLSASNMNIRIRPWGEGSGSLDLLGRNCALLTSIFQCNLISPWLPIAVVEDPCNPTRDFPPCDCWWSCFIRARLNFLFSLNCGLWCLADTRGRQCPKIHGECKSSYSHDTDHPCCWSPRTKDTVGEQCTDSPFCHHVLTREQDFHHSFPRKLLLYLPVSKNYVGKHGLSPRKCPAEVLYHVMSHPSLWWQGVSLKTLGKVLNLKRLSEFSVDFEQEICLQNPRILRAPPASR